MSASDSRDPYSRDPSFGIEYDIYVALTALINARRHMWETGDTRGIEQITRAIELITEVIRLRGGVAV